MMKHLAPDCIIGHPEDFDFEQLRDRGVRHIVLDIDNTLVLQGLLELSPAQMNFLTGLIQNAGFETVSLATNSLRDLSAMAASIEAKLFQPCGRIRKPLPGYYQGILRHLGCQPHEAAMFDDKLIHVIGAKRVGMVAIQVAPLAREHWLDRLVMRRPIEQLLLRHWRLPST